MFHLQNFKNFAEASLDIDEPVTLLIGPNGAGKSNLIEAIEILCFVASGKPLREITDLGREGGLEVRGGLAACARRGQQEFTLSYEGKLPKKHHVNYKITIRVGEIPRITEESLYIDGRDTAVFEVIPSEEDTASADNRVRYDNHAQGGTKPEESIAGDRSALSQYARFARKNKKLAETLSLIDAVIDALSAPAVFDPIPKLMRGYERDTETKLARNGFNLSPVLAKLRKGKMSIERQKSGKFRIVHKSFQAIEDRILGGISRLPDEPFKSFDFIRTRTQDVMLGFRVNNDDKPVTARVLSDGTLRALAVLTALETGSVDQRIIVEEFDNGVHPSRVQVLTGALFDCSSRNHLRSLVTTHNPATLNALTDEQTDSVVLVTQSRESHQGILVPMRELPGYVEFIEQGRLGDLITRRIYESHLSKGYEQERQTEIEKWVDQLP